MSAAVGRHRRPVERAWRPTREALRRAARSRTTLASSALACLALAALAGQVGGTGADPAPTSVAASVAGVTGLDEVLDTFDRRSAAGSLADRESVLSSAVAAAQAAEEEPAAEISATEAVAPPAPPAPVAGLDQVQMDNALKIVQTGQAMGLPPRAFVIAVATAMQESNLRNLASTRIPESYQYNAEGEGSDHDSVGLFQQRVSTGWGLVSQLMDPNYAASAFYAALVRVPGWESMELTWAAQRVQVSAFPYAYAKHEPRATEIVSALLAPATPAP